MAGKTHLTSAHAEALFLIACLRQGWEIAKPLHDVYPYDYVIRRNGVPWETVQVKAAYTDASGNSRQPKRVVSLRHGMHTYRRAARYVYKDGDFDLLAGVDLQREEVYLIPWTAIKHLRSTLPLHTCAPFRVDSGYQIPTDAETLGAVRRVHRQNPLYRLSLDVAEQIRADYRTGLSQRALSDKYGVAQSHIGRIVRNEVWVTATHTLDPDRH